MIGQQISLAAAATGAAKLAAAYGERGRPARPGPDPAVSPADALAAADPGGAADARRSRGRALVGLARALSAGTLDLAAEQPGRSRAALLAQPGIGPWTADYLAMRAFGDRDVLLATDLVIKRELARRGITSTSGVGPLPLVRDDAPLVAAGCSS